uniref:Zinc finger protein 750-like zinc finger domain-containing protein n=1 Tax=Anolis carolinensis TaxID=28377 RepID=H9G3T1_ANOCA
MSKDELGCKLAPVYKHKERKPKKPHYIPRPWGKPYNYKCFQCPFTCMEKSHLYNHMKYSLCKNSLSLLIESDWPYKKGNLLHPELRLLHATEASRARGRQEEAEACDPPCKVPKKCPGSSGVLMEQWKLVANGQRRAAPGEVSAPCPDGNIIPCYPPPAYGEFHEPQSLNLSLLGINYPLNPNLFSYLGPSVASGAAPHSHLAQLPFLASTAQLMHPHSAHFQPLQNPERSAFLPRFYYPLLFEHSFASAENKVANVKPEPQQSSAAAVPTPSQPKPVEQPKAGLLKVPVLKTTLPWMKGFREEMKKTSGCSTRRRATLCWASTACAGSPPSRMGTRTSLASKTEPPFSPTVSGKQTSLLHPEVTTVLIGDLSKTLEEYQEVEKKLSDLAKEDTPAQKQLRDQLVKIRHELFHIHQALEKATKPNEGPLDLSVKRPSQEVERDGKEPKAGSRYGKDPGSIGRSEHLRASSVEPYYSRTTKCEADSSVLLCTDGRSNASGNPGPPLSVAEDVPLGCRAVPRSLSCGLPSETDRRCIHSPLNTDP